MKAVQLPHVDLQIPAVGFGCNSILSEGRSNALRLLATAFDAGVRHFDVARSYGTGEAEGILGAFLKSRRSQVTITTKFGIQPVPQTILMRVAIHSARQLGRLAPSTHTLFRRVVSTLSETGVFEVDSVQEGLETSLRALRTDYVDIFLMHEYTAVERREDLLAFLEGAVKAGKIRHFGVGATIERVLRAIDLQPDLCGVVQFPNSVVDRNLMRVSQEKKRIHITHTALGKNCLRLFGLLGSDPIKRKRWSSELGLDCGNADILAALMLNYAVAANPNGLILISSKNPSRIIKNVRAALDPCMSDSQIVRFADLVAEELANPWIVSDHTAPCNYQHLQPEMA
jgi:D-threo-aldose 1-dehydrogenase